MPSGQCFGCIFGVIKCAFLLMNVGLMVLDAFPVGTDVLDCQVHAQFEGRWPALAAPVLVLGLSKQCLLNLSA